MQVFKIWIGCPNLGHITLYNSGIVEQEKELLRFILLGRRRENVSELGQSLTEIYTQKISS